MRVQDGLASKYIFTIINCSNLYKITGNADYRNQQIKRSQRSLRLDTRPLSTRTCRYDLTESPRIPDAGGSPRPCGRPQCIILD